ncbi:DUF4214 domain-containing protein [Verticiella sediminum]|uniref:DUF4214 domain-containing protein n=1 Tax=Verticiella sediminum TaxID=1247510 RepID=A0A556AGJ7_9BURK|nr:DUF4214 domain-containing protein [Verticiella sediminum]TSH92018.1 DUF4214 domain-containing protein [Verticiella sediminum]
MQYDTPVAIDDVLGALDDSQRLSATTLSAIEQLLQLSALPGEPSPRVEVGSALVGEGAPQFTLPSESAPAMLVVNGSGPAPLFLNSAELPLLAQIPVVVFDTGNPVTFLVPGDDTVSAGYGRDAVLLRADGDDTVPAHGIDRIIVSGQGDDDIRILDNGNTTIEAAFGNDTIVTSGGFDSVTGGQGNDVISTGAGDDTIVSGVGHDTLDGGTGFDVVQVQGGFDDFELTVEEGVIVLVRRMAEGEAVDSITATDVNFFEFSDGTALALGATEQETAILRLYEGLFGRPADPTGAVYWLRDDAGTIGLPDRVADVADAFLGTAEGQYWLDMDERDFVANLYTHALGREAIESDIDYWAGDLAAGHTRGAVAANIIGSDEAADYVVTVKLIDGLL